MTKFDDKYLLLTAGPAPVSEEIRQILSEPMMYHRSADFVEVYGEVSERLKNLFQTNSDVLILTASGTGAMEAAVCNFFSPHEKVLVVTNGKFSERWKLICQAFDLDVYEIGMQWGKSISFPTLLEQVRSIDDLKGIFLTYCETSTGALTNLERVSAAIRKETDALIVVDAISAVPTIPFFMESWGIDVAIAASQKGLGLPPGIAFVAVSPRAWVAAELSELPKYYFNLIRYRQTNRLKIGSAFTPSIIHVKAANFALKKLEQITLTQFWREREKIASYFRDELKNRGLKIFPDFPSNSLTVLDFSENGHADKIIEILKEKYRIIVSGGQGQLRGKAIRVGHMVNVGINELNRFLIALDEILAQ